MYNATIMVVVGWIYPQRILRIRGKYLTAKEVVQRSIDIISRNVLEERVVGD